MIVKYDAKCEACNKPMPAGTNAAAGMKLNSWIFLCQECADKGRGNFKRPRGILEAVCIFLYSDDPEEELDHHDLDVLIDLGLYQYPAA